MKEDRIIPVFRCQVIKTIMSQYCSHWLAAGVIIYVGFWEPKTLEAWECRLAKVKGRYDLGEEMIQMTKGATKSCSVFLSCSRDDDSKYEAG
jgi:hypothetical protein